MVLLEAGIVGEAGKRGCRRVSCGGSRRRHSCQYQPRNKALGWTACRGTHPNAAALRCHFRRRSISRGLRGQGPLYGSQWARQMSRAPSHCTIRARPEQAGARVPPAASLIYAPGLSEHRAVLLAPRAPFENAPPLDTARCRVLHRCCPPACRPLSPSAAPWLAYSGRSDIGRGARRMSDEAVMTDHPRPRRGRGGPASDAAPSQREWLSPAEAGRVEGDVAFRYPRVAGRNGERHRRSGAPSAALLKPRADEACRVHTLSTRAVQGAAK